MQLRCSAAISIVVRHDHDGAVGIMGCHCLNATIALARTGAKME
jgi:hypothetical protein